MLLKYKYLKTSIPHEATAYLTYKTRLLLWVVTTHNTVKDLEMTAKLNVLSDTQRKLSM